MPWAGSMPAGPTPSWSPGPRLPGGRAGAIDRGNAGEVARRMSAYQAGVQERLKAAELAQVERRHVPRRRRRGRSSSGRGGGWTWSLAATVLVMAGLAGTSWVRMAQDRAARNAVATQAIADANRLHDLAVRGPLVDIARLGEAIAAADRARAVLGPAGHSTQRETTQALLAKLERERQEAETDRTMLARLAELRQARGGDFAELIEADRDLARAFAEYGIPVDALPTDEAGARIHARPREVGVELAAALDDWALIRRRRSLSQDKWTKLLETARLADADAHRDGLRAALLVPDRSARRDALRKLAVNETNVNALAAPSLDLLGSALLQESEYETAERMLRRARQRFPGDVWINDRLAHALEDLGPPKAEEAVRYYTVVQALSPFMSHRLGHALEAVGRDDEAISVFRELIRRGPKTAHHNVCLARALLKKGATREANESLDQAISEFRATLKSYPDDYEAHGVLGDALTMRGRSAAATRELREAMRLAPNSTTYRYNAACAAALAGCGRSRDDPPPDDFAKARWRKQAIDWLTADLAAWAKNLESGPPQARQAISRTLQHWKADTDLAGLRDPAAVGELPEDEQKACRALWAEVDALLAKASGGIKSSGETGR